MLFYSWNTLGCGVDEESVKAAAGLVVSLGLKEAGYELVIVLLRLTSSLS